MQALFTFITYIDKCMRGDAGIALRVPTPNVSVVDLVIQTEKKTFAEEVNEAFRDYSQNKGKVSCHCHRQLQCVQACECV